LGSGCSASSTKGSPEEQKFMLAAKKKSIEKFFKENHEISPERDDGF
jgi:hypothetical protein